MNPFQWLVDESQKQPQWWCRQTAKVICVAAVLVLVFTDCPWSVGDSVANFGAIIGAGCFVLISGSALLCASFANRPTRWWFWAWSLFAVMHVTSAEKAADCLATLAATAFVEFAFCRPPAPPKHRGRRLAEVGT